MKMTKKSRISQTTVRGVQSKLSGQDAPIATRWSPTEVQKWVEHARKILVVQEVMWDSNPELDALLGLNQKNVNKAR